MAEPPGPAQPGGGDFSATQSAPNAMNGSGATSEAVDDSVADPLDATLGLRNSLDWDDSLNSTAHTAEPESSVEMYNRSHRKSMDDSTLTDDSDYGGRMSKSDLYSPERAESGNLTKLEDRDESGNRQTHLMSFLNSSRSDSIKYGSASKKGYYQQQGALRAAMVAKKMANEVHEQTKAIEVVQEYFRQNKTDIKIHRGNKAGKGLTSTPTFKYTGDGEIQIRLPFLIFHPFAGWRLFWDMVVMVVLVYSFVAVPLRVAFEDSSRSNCHKGFFKQSLMFYYDLTIDFLFIFDIFLNFRTAIVLDEKRMSGNVITDWKQIGWRYLKGFFWIDAASCVPTDLILLVTCGGEGLNGANKLLRGPLVLKFIRIVRVTRLLRVTRIKKFFLQIRDTLHIHPGIIRVLRFIFIVALCAHWNACLFFFIGINAMEQEVGVSRDDSTFQEKLEVLSYKISFVTDADFDMERNDNLGAVSGSMHEILCSKCSPLQSDFGLLNAAGLVTSTLPQLPVYTMGWFEQYLVSLYWSTTTMTTVGFGDIHPENTYEVLFTMIVLMEAGMAFSYMVGNMANLVSRIDLRHKRFKESMEILDDFIYKESIRGDLASRIRAYKQYLYKHPVAKIPQFARRELSNTLLRDITAHMYRKILYSLPLFKGLHADVLTELALALEPVQLPPHSVIYREDDIGDSMYFVSEGDVEMSMLLMSERLKNTLGVKVVADRSLADSAAIMTDKKGKRFFRMHSRNGTSYDWIGKDDSDHPNNGFIPKEFRWRINEGNSISFFGEGVLTGHPIRQATATTASWCVLFRLDQKALQQVAKKFGVMDQVYKRIRSTQASKLIRAARMLVNGRKISWQNTCKLYLRIEKGVNMPRMDGFLGLCDPYCSVRLGHPDPDKKEFHTLVQYNKLNPTWNETFVYPIEFSVDFLIKGFPVYVYLEVRDYDVLGDHDQIGSCRLDVTDLLYKTLTNHVNGKLSKWCKLKEMRNSVLRDVRGYNKKKTQVKVSMEIVPPKQRIDVEALQQRNGSSFNGTSFQGRHEAVEVSAMQAGKSIYKPKMVTRRALPHGPHHGHHHNPHGHDDYNIGHLGKDHVNSLILHNTHGQSHYPSKEGTNPPPDEPFPQAPDMNKDLSGGDSSDHGRVGDPQSVELDQLLQTIDGGDEDAAPRPAKRVSRKLNMDINTINEEASDSPSSANLNTTAQGTLERLNGSGSDGMSRAGSGGSETDDQLARRRLSIGTDGGESDDDHYMDLNSTLVPDASEGLVMLLTDISHQNGHSLYVYDRKNHAVVTTPLQQAVGTFGASFKFDRVAGDSLGDPTGLPDQHPDARKEVVPHNITEDTRDMPTWDLSFLPDETRRFVSTLLRISYSQQKTSETEIANLHQKVEELQMQMQLLKETVDGHVKFTGVHSSTGNASRPPFSNGLGHTHPSNMPAATGFASTGYYSRSKLASTLPPGAPLPPEPPQPPRPPGSRGPRSMSGAQTNSAPGERL